MSKKADISTWPSTPSQIRSHPDWRRLTVDPDSSTSPYRQIMDQFKHIKYSVFDMLDRMGDATEMELYIGPEEHGAVALVKDSHILYSIHESPFLTIGKHNDRERMATELSARAAAVTTELKDLMRLADEYGLAFSIHMPNSGDTSHIEYGGDDRRWHGAWSSSWC